MAAPAIYNAMHDRRPRAVVRCVDGADVIAALAVARENEPLHQLHGGRRPGGTNMKWDADMSLVDAARQLAPVILEHAQEAERERRLSRPVLDALRAAGLLRLFVPRSLGGLEVTPITRALVVEELSAHDTAAGWTLENPLDWAYLCARLPDRGAEEIYGDSADIVIAAQYGRPLSATSSPGGYRISGRAPLFSNCCDADWIASTAFVDGDRDSLVMVYLPSAKCDILDTWDAMGMRGTGSHDVSVTDVEVPWYRTFSLAPEFETGSHYQGPLYRFPLPGIAATGIPTVLLGAARRALDEVIELARTKTPVASESALKERSSTQAMVARAEAVLRSGRSFLYDTLSQAWRVSVEGGTHSMTQRADLLLAMTHAMSSAVEAVELACRIAGTTAFRASSPFERCFRDAQTLKHHAFAAEGRYETVGKVYFGLPPDFPATAL
jgi:alkylation response protein AidB-like acyl-CoA dehydrogenase